MGRKIKKKKVGLIRKSLHEIFSGAAPWMDRSVDVFYKGCSTTKLP